MIYGEHQALRVLQVGMTRNLGGIETYLIEQFRHLDTNRITYDFVNITGEYAICYEDEILGAGSKIFKVVSRHKNPILHYWQWFTIAVKNRGIYDAVVLNTNSLEYVFPLVLGMLFHIPVRVIHSHNSGFENKQGLARRLLVGMNKKLLSWSANLRFACSRFAGRWMFGNEPYHVIYNAIDIHKYDADDSVRAERRQSLGLDEALTVLHVGRFSYQKNHAFLLDIFKEVHRIHPDSVLLLVGDTTEETEYLSEVKRKIREYGLDDSVRLLGRRDDVNRIMQAADVLVMPSFFEGLTVVGIEAQASDLPLLLSDTVTRELGLLPSTQFISLDAGADTWAQAVIEAKRNHRQSRYDELKTAGYDIEHETKRVENLLIGTYHKFINK
ncbi:glycosyltransferase [Veillonella sp. AS16]|uniref:glycosyltransferase n=1 Tax=Veillonella sp. AS16 TaxID=936589 RepID=UPI0003E27818|nr:glycosyltransferase [Veillonella sp. AS16]ETS92431.1 glycosyltransferase, group 1 family protein [Veillonella sp. AS16]